MVSHPIRNLLKGLIDYAGLFPPARLEMALAVQEFERQRKGENGFIVDRFVVPANRLEELAAARPPGGQAIWPLSVLVGYGDLGAERAQIEKLERGGLYEIASLEAKPQVPGEVARYVEAFPDRKLYCELPLKGDPSPWLDALLEFGGRAKVRTGGITAEAFPQVAELARFLFTAAAIQLPFKATAGLHHPLRGEYRLTYDEGSPSGTMHGFLNVFLAAAFLRAGEIDEAATRELLAETRESAFEWTTFGVRWGNYRLSAEAIAESRKGFALSYGSCSIDEPLADLRRLHLL